MEHDVEIESEVKLPKGIELEKGEQLVLLVRRHWFVFRDPTLLMLFVPFVAVWGVLMLELSNVNIGVRNVAGVVLLYGAAIAFVVGLLWFLWKYYLWKNTIYLVTSKRIIIINQLGLFTHDDRETGLTMIQDVRARVDGLQPTLYGYGDVILQVSSQDAQLIFEKVGKPRDVQRAIIREAHLKEVKQ